VISLQGPKSREVLTSVVSLQDKNILSNENFPYSTAKKIDLNLSNMKVMDILTMRVTFVGELGYELYVPYSVCKILVDDLMNNTGGVHVR
jgi:4-methylaminobutanoate oxidase (formaldehyde-forming)